MIKASATVEPMFDLDEAVALLEAPDRLLTPDEQAARLAASRELSAWVDARLDQFRIELDRLTATEG